MSARFEVRVRDFQAAMFRIQNELGISAPKVFSDQMRLLVKELQRVTWPRTKKQGENAVERDILHAVRPLDAQAFAGISNPKLRARLTGVARSKDKEALLTILRNTHGHMRDAKIVDFSPSLHTSARNSRGRVPKPLGRYTFDGAEVKAYVAKVKAAVGWAKGGWNAGAFRLGTLMAPWVRRHATKGGTASGNPADKIEPNIVMTNRANKIPGSQAILEHALKVRAKNMTKWLEVTLDRIMRRN